MCELWTIYKGLEGPLTLPQIRKCYLAYFILLTWIVQVIYSGALSRKFPLLISITRLDSAAFQVQRFLVTSLMFGGFF